MNYKELSDNSRVWVYQSDRELVAEEVEQIIEMGEEFVRDWAAHGEELNAAIAVFYNKFIVLFADESKVIASGCSIDTSINFMKSIETEFGIELFDRLSISYKVNDEINCLRMGEFQEALANGQLNENTIVFNNLVQTKKEFETVWEVPIKDSWHVQLLP